VVKKIISFERNPLLAGPSLENRVKTGSPYREIPLTDIDVDPEQPRRSFDTEGLAELAESIKSVGVLCPILVKAREGGTFRLVSGERRYRAAKLAGLSSIPAILDFAEDDGGNTLVKQVIENVQRRDLSPLERSLAIGQLRDTFGLSIRDICRKLGVSKGLVQRSLDVLQLPDDLQAALAAGASESKILLLGGVGDRELRKELLAQIDDLTRNQLREEIIRLESGGFMPVGEDAYHGGTSESLRDEGRPASSPEDLRILDDLRRSLGLKVGLVRSQEMPKRGKLTIEFYSDEDLCELHNRLTSELDSDNLFSRESDEIVANSK